MDLTQRTPRRPLALRNVLLALAAPIERPGVVWLTRREKCVGTSADPTEVG